MFSVNNFNPFPYLEDRGPVWESVRVYTYTQRAKRALTEYLNMLKGKYPGQVGWTDTPVDGTLSQDFRYWLIRSWEEIFPELKAGVVILEANPMLQTHAGGK